MKGKMQLFQKMMQDPSGFIDTEPIQAITLLLAQEERELQESIAELVEASEADLDVELQEPEQRADRLRRGLKAMVRAEIPETWVREFSELENADEAAKVAGLDEDEWREQRGEWADRWRDQGLEGTDRELAEAHVRARFDMDLEDFERYIVEWPDEREQAALRKLLSGPIKASQEQIEAVTETLQDQE